MGAAACPNRPDSSEDQETRAPRYAAEQVSTDAAAVSQLAGSLVPVPSPIFHTQSSLPISTPSQFRFLFPTLNPSHKISLLSGSHSDLLIWLSLLITSLSPIPTALVPAAVSWSMQETGFLLLGLVHDPFPLLATATSHKVMKKIFFPLAQSFCGDSQHLCP